MPRGSRHFPLLLTEEEQRPIRTTTIRRVVEAFRPYRRRVALVVGTILVTSGLGVVNPLLIKVVFDQALFTPQGVILGTLFALVGIMVAVPVVSGLINVWQTYLSNVVGQRVMQDLRNALYRHLQRMPLRFFTNTRTGEIQSRLANDVGGVQKVVTDTASDTLSNGVIVLTTIIAMLILSWELTLLAVGTIPVFLWLTYKVGKARQRVAASTQQSMAEVSAITQETLSVSGMLLSKAFGRQGYEVDRFGRENQRLADLQLRQQLIGRSFFAVIYSFFSITPALVYLLAGFLLAGDVAPGITAGTIVAFTTLQSRMFFPLGQMLQVGVEVQSAMALFDRIFEYLDLEPEIQDRPGAATVRRDEVEGRIRFRDVRFRYDSLPETDGEDPAPDGAQRGLAWTLEDVDLRIEPGQLAALVGPSGAGKTTLTYLVPRLYDVQRGVVEIDGRDVRDIRLASLGEIVGMVTQESYLFHSTVRENLRYGRPEATDEELETASRAAFIHDRIMDLPDGYDTPVGERGYKLSGGEKQRLAIARVILKDPRILILDEATSSLDTASERLVQAALRPLMRGRTTIAIAHRLSTILAADVIFVMDRGRIVERGTHDELVGRGGLYADLYEKQFHGGAVEAELEDGVVLPSGEVVPRAASGA